MDSQEARKSMTLAKPHSEGVDAGLSEMSGFRFAAPHRRTLCHGQRKLKGHDGIKCTQEKPG